MKVNCAILSVGLFALTVHGTAARAQSDSPPKKAISSSPAAARNDQTKLARTNASDQKRIDELLSQCVKDWDTKTHMTKRDWTRVCRGVVYSRTQYYKQNGGDLSSIPR